MSFEEEKICKMIQKRIQYQLNHTWVGVIDSTQKDLFLKNFSPDDEVVGYVLLDMLLLHNQAQERQLIKSLMKKLYSRVYKSIRNNQKLSGPEIESCIAEEMENACFFPVSDKNTADSSNAWMAIIREQVGTSECFYDINAIPLLASIKKRYFVFFDDMIGTGNQFSSFLSCKRYKINEKKFASIGDILLNNGIKVYYLCLAGYCEGIKMISDAYKVEIISSEFFEEDDSVLSKNNEYWAYYPDDFRDHIIERIECILNKMEIEEPYTRNLAVMFERNRPSNTICPLYWKKTNQWTPIKSREGE